MVRLLLVVSQCEGGRYAGFNPTMVRLLPLISCFLPYSPRIVSIPQWCDCCGKRSKHSTMYLLGFNPTMVRLLLILAQMSHVLLLFQSHNGAIAAWRARLCRERDIRVSIPQWCDCCSNRGIFQSTTHAGFNPTMVRLLQCHRICMWFL